MQQNIPPSNFVIISVHLAQIKGPDDKKEHDDLKLARIIDPGLVLEDLRQKGHEHNEHKEGSFTPVVMQRGKKHRDDEENPKSPKHACTKLFDGHGGGFTSGTLIKVFRNSFGTCRRDLILIFKIPIIFIRFNCWCWNAILFIFQTNTKHPNRVLSTM